MQLYLAAQISNHVAGCRMICIADEIALVPFSRISSTSSSSAAAAEVRARRFAAQARKLALSLWLACILLLILQITKHIHSSNTLPLQKTFHSAIKSFNKQRLSILL